MGDDTGSAPRLLDVVRRAARVRRYSPRTEEAYVRWIVDFVRWSGLRHPRDLGHTEVTAWLSALATERRVAASTQNQALAAILFLYGPVLGLALPWLDDLVRAKKPARLPVVLSRSGVASVLGEMVGPRGWSRRCSTALDFG